VFVLAIVLSCVVACLHHFAETVLHCALIGRLCAILN